MSILQRIGAALVETGQSMQRLGLRASGYKVIKPNAYKTIGAERPFITDGAKVSRNAVIVGKVSLGSWCVVGDAVIRGENAPVYIGRAVEIGDGAVIHSTITKSLTGLPVQIDVGQESKIGRGVVLDSCTICDYSTVGDNSVVSAGCYIESHGVLQPDSVLPPSHRIPAHEIWGGNPAKFIGVVEEH